MNQILERAIELKDEIIANRRYLHRFPEIEMDLPRTTSYVKEKLKEMGYEPVEICKSGIVAVVGKTGKTIMLRADMDALPMQEATDLDFKSENDYGHTCGHDTHTAMLLGAAKILKEHEKELEGTVKLMFQPAEENLVGAKAMLDSNLLENPHVDAAMAMHIVAASDETGVITYTTGEMDASADRFTITVKGKGGHGAGPEDCIDPINIGAHILLSLQEIISREVAPIYPAVLTIGTFHAGNAGNIIPETAVLEGSIRTYSDEVRTFIKERMNQICKLTAEKFRGEAYVDYVSGVPPLINDETVTLEMLKYAKEIVGDKTGICEKSMGSEDFAYVAESVPSTYFYLGAGTEKDGYIYGGHHPKVMFDEEALPIGAAVYANCAMRWLENNK